MSFIHPIAGSFKDCAVMRALSSLQHGPDRLQSGAMCWLSLFLVLALFRGFLYSVKIFIFKFHLTPYY